MSAVRYEIYAQPVGYTGGRAGHGRVLQSGKLVSADKNTRSAIATVPEAPSDTEPHLRVYGVYTDGSAKTGQGYSFLQISDAGVDPTPGQSEAAVESPPRIVIQPPMAQGAITVNAPGFPCVDIAMRSGQRFAIQDTGWAV